MPSDRLALYELVEWCATNLRPGDDAEQFKPYRVFPWKPLNGPLKCATFSLGALVFLITKDIPTLRIVDVIWFDEQGSIDSE